MFKPGDKVVLKKDEQSQESKIQEGLDRIRGRVCTVKYVYNPEIILLEESPIIFCANRFELAYPNRKPFARSNGNVPKG